MHKRISEITIAAILMSAGSTYAQDQTTPQDRIHTIEIHSHSMQSSPNASKAPFDQQFLDTMTAHHQSANDMAQIAQSQATHDELRGLAMQMLEEQQRDIEHMQAMKQQWYGDQGNALNMHMPGMKESMQGMQDKMAKLQGSHGSAFDAMFLTMMINHHQHGIRMAANALSKARHHEIKGLARKIIDSQQKEIELMNQWKSDWKLGPK